MNEDLQVVEETQDAEQELQALAVYKDQDLIQEAKRFQNDKLVDRTLADNINKAHADYLKLGEDVLDLGLRIENARIALGTMLVAAKETIGHGGFVDWINENLTFCDRTAQRYMAYSKKRNGELFESIEDVREYKKLLVFAGFEEGSEGQGHGVQQRHEWSPFAAVTKIVGKTNETFALIWEHKPRDEWEEDELEELKEQLSPIVELYESL